MLRCAVTCCCVLSHVTEKAVTYDSALSHVTEKAIACCLALLPFADPKARQGMAKEGKGTRPETIRGRGQGTQLQGRGQGKPDWEKILLVVTPCSRLTVLTGSS